MMQSDNAIVVNHVTKAFKVYLDKGSTLKEKILFKNRRKYSSRIVLNDISFKIRKGESVGLIGENGSGKSTLAKIIMGIITPDSGQILFHGEDITSLSVSERASKGLAFAFQQPVKFKGITVFDLLNIATKKKLEKKGACEILSKVGLCAREYVDREVNASLSGGELKRIEIATVMARNPKVAIFDEPEAGIDLWSFKNLIHVFEKMHEEIQGSIVIISHQERILNIADKIIVISNGEIVKEGTKENVLPSLLNVSEGCRFMKEENEWTQY